MTTPKLILKQVEVITSNLIKIGLSVQQNYPANNLGNISYSGMHDISIAMKNASYTEIYNMLDRTKNFNIKMIDGALIQILYSYNKNILISHRLAFFPSPTLESFQNEPELYQEDEIYADILHKSIVTVPFRFDYEASEDKFKEIEHPKSHITFGQYKNCRIPVSEPLTPEIFINFILRNFYNIAFLKYKKYFQVSTIRFDKTISLSEKALLHFGCY